MEYSSLYRRFRPDAFDKVIGQDYIVRTLTNMIKSGNIAHAFLFTGTRGTGKTSSAKIFAKAVNCLEPIDGSPCGKCAVCRALCDPSNLDIIEMDAASNNGVDDMREIRETVKYPPSVGRYKVYIIDEVHMLSGGAFNALLKTLEEPPSHVIFILATTEAHKIPQTILSRCIRFDFKLVPTVDLTELLLKIFGEIGKPCEEQAAVAIANAGDGSVRDALSIADMCVSYCDGAITYEQVLEVLGASSPDSILDICEDIVRGDIGNVLVRADALLKRGKSVSQLNKDIITYLRNIVYAKNTDDAGKLLNLPVNVYERVKRVSERADNGKILRAVTTLAANETAMRYSNQPGIVLEMSLVKACGDMGLDGGASTLTGDAEKKIKELEKKIGELAEELKNVKAGGGADEGVIAADGGKGVPCNVEMGLIIDHSRRNRNFNLLSCLNDVKYSYMIGRTIYLEIDDEASYKYIKDESALEYMMRALKNKRNVDNIVPVSIVKKEVNFDGEIGAVKELFDTPDDKIVQVNSNGGN